MMLPQTKASHFPSLGVYFIGRNERDVRFWFVYATIKEIYKINIRAEYVHCCNAKSI